MDLFLYHAEERLANNLPAQNIGCRITTTETAFQLYYWTWGCGDGLCERRNATTFMKRGGIW